MSSATLILWVITTVFFLLSIRESTDTARKGAELAWQTSKQNALLIILAFIIVGFVNILSPEEFVKTWIGPESGWTGILLAEFMGMLLPGGPYVVFPLIAILFEAGAGLAPVITLITSWSTQSLLTIGFELPFMGWRFTVIRWSFGLLIPLLAGLIALLISG
jgi:uncharacterized membrane protein YraQ (UPF0718 family)